MSRMSGSHRALPVRTDFLRLVVSRDMATPSRLARPREPDETHQRLQRPRKRRQQVGGPTDAENVPAQEALRPTAEERQCAERIIDQMKNAEPKISAGNRAKYGPSPTSSRATSLFTAEKSSSARRTPNVSSEWPSRPTCTRSGWTTCCRSYSRKSLPPSPSHLASSGLSTTLLEPQ